MIIIHFSLFIDRTVDLGHWAFDIQMHLLTELEICDLIEEHSFVSKLNVDCPISNVESNSTLA